MMRSIFSHLNSFAMALLFAIVVWAVATSEQNPSREGLYSEPLPIEMLNRSAEMLVIQKTPETVRVKIRAPQVSWDELKPASFRVTVNLEGLGPGEQQVRLSAQVNDPRVTILSIEPAIVNVRLEKFKSREVEVRSEVLDASPLGYIYRTPSATPAQVTLSGPAPLVDQVTDVSADVYLRGAKASVEREVSVTPRDANGNAVQGVTVTPSTVLVKVPVEQRVGYKDVSIRALLKGTVAPGYWISNIVVAPSTITIAGNPDALAKIQGFVETVAIDVSTAAADVSKRAAISLPEGVSILNNEGVIVQISVTPIMGGQTVRRKVALLGLRRGLTATVSPDTIEVILSGPVPSLQNLAAEDAGIIVDVSTLGVGVHQLKPRVSAVPDALRVQSIVPDTVQVVIVDPALTPTPTAVPVPPATATPAAVPAPTLTPVR
jgi:YbbR domain-containing protein